MKPGNYFIIAFVVLMVCSCDESFIPEGLYGYQVERLLSGDAGNNWYAINESPGFDQLYIEPSGDSIRIYEINNQIDTISFRTANASEITNLFTDTLFFSDADIWLIRDILPDQFSIITDTGDGTVYNFSNQNSNN